jgi:hypothetical protein
VWRVVSSIGGDNGYFYLEGPWRLRELMDWAVGGMRLTATGYWHPAGILGLLYWYSLEPVHRVIFSRMTVEICRRAEREAPRSSTPLP